jgi:hypothetical protein
MKSPYSILLTVLILFIASHLHAQTYVNQNATGANDGSSWSDAYVSVHDALDNYSAEEEIWVAAGTYLPGESSAWTADPRTTFYIHQNVKLYGGFNGTETTLDERDPLTYQTILSGDLAADDVEGDPTLNRDDNAVNVLYLTSNINNNTIIDGFHIISGQADENGAILENQRGAGIWSYGSPQVRNCHIRENYALLYGAGFYARGASAGGSIVDGCVFENNIAEIGGGGATLSTATSIDVVQVSNCVFHDNSTPSFGAGLYIFDSSVSVSDCLFESNVAGITGGGMFISPLNEDNCTVSGCDFIDNIAANGGACGMQGTGTTTSSNTSFDSCNFSGNQALSSPEDGLPDGGAIYIEYLAEGAQNNIIDFSDCLFQANIARVGGGINVIHFDGSNNQLIINNTEFLDNIALDGGAIQVWELGGNTVSSLVQNSIFSGNSGNFFQAIAQINQNPESGCEMDIVNCLFYQNGAAETNKSVLATSGVMSVRSCTFSNNESTNINLRDAGELTIQNTILNGLSNPNIVVSTPQDATLTSYGGNLLSDASMNDWVNALDQQDADPLFMTGTYTLSENSPCVDAGVIFSNNPSLDLAGNARVQGGCIDIGAYESSFNAGSGCVSWLSELIDEASILDVFPNPVSDRMQVTIENDWKGEIRLRIIDLLGNQVYSKRLNKVDQSLKVELSISELPSSTYIIEISNDYAIALKSIIKL